MSILEKPQLLLDEQKTRSQNFDWRLPRPNSFRMKAAFISCLALATARIGILSVLFSWLPRRTSSVEESIQRIKMDSVRKEMECVNWYLETGDLLPLMLSVESGAIQFKRSGGLWYKSLGGCLTLEDDLYTYSYLLGEKLDTLIRGTGKDYMTQVRLRIQAGRVFLSRAKYQKTTIAFPDD